MDMQDKHLKVLHILSAFYFRLGDVTRALALVAVAAEAAPNDPDLAETLIRCYIATGQAEAALKRLDQLGFTAGRRRERELDGLRSQALWVAGRREEARRLYASVLDDWTALS